MKRHRVFLQLRNGTKYHFTIKANPDKIDQVLRAVDNTWIKNEEGFIMLAGFYIRNMDISIYRVRRLFLGLF